MRNTLFCLLISLSSLDALSILGRDGKPLYELEVPEGWTPILTPPDQITDTREPLLSWEKGSLEARLHSFPYYKETGFIPPQAQVTRWLRKFASEPLYETIPCSHGGFEGLLLVAEWKNEGFFGAAFSVGRRGRRAFRDHHHFSSDWTFVVKGPSAELFNEKPSLITWIESLKFPFEIPHVD